LKNLHESTFFYSGDKHLVDMADNSAASPETEKAQKGKAQKKGAKVVTYFRLFAVENSTSGREGLYQTLSHNPLEIKFLPQIP
jgi:hypothetical protein